MRAIIVYDLLRLELTESEYVDIQVFNFVGKFHQWVQYTDYDNVVITGTLVERQDGTVTEVELNLVQFVNTTMQTATHREQGILKNATLRIVDPYYRYSKDEYAQIYTAKEVWEDALISNLELYENACYKKI